MKRVEALKLMAEGWELSVTRDIRSGATVQVQKGGAGRGGEVRRLSWTVYEAMKKRGEIEKVEETEATRRFWRDRYRLKATPPSTTANRS